MNRRRVGTMLVAAGTFGMFLIGALFMWAVDSRPQRCVEQVKMIVAGNDGWLVSQCSHADHATVVEQTPHGVLVVCRCKAKP